MTKVSEGKFRKRSFEEVMRSKQIYKKHALRYKDADYYERKAKRMLLYSANLTGMLAEYATKRID